MPPPPPPSSTTTTTTSTLSSPITIPLAIRLDKPVPPLPPPAMTVSNMAETTSSGGSGTSASSTTSSTNSNSRRRPSADQHHSHHHHFFPSRSSNAHSHKLSSSPSSSSSPMLMFRSIVAVVKDKFTSSNGSTHDRSHGSPGSDSGHSSTPTHTMSCISSSSMTSLSETSISTIGSSRSIPLSQSSARRPSGDVHSSSSFSFAALSSPPPTSPAPLVRAIPVPHGSPKPTGAPLASLDGIPDLVRESFAYIERHGSTVEGIYRTACPGADLLGEWAAQFDSKSGRRMVPRDLDAQYAPDAVAQAVKNYFKALPEEVISPRHVVGIWELIQAEKQRAAALADALDSGTEEDAAAASVAVRKDTIAAIRAYVRANLIRPHRVMLAAVLRHLQVMAGHADKTRVTAKTLSMLWPSVVCCPHATAQAMEVIEEAMFLKAQAPGPFEWMIEHAKEVTIGW